MTCQHRPPQRTTGSSGCTTGYAKHFDAFEVERHANEATRHRMKENSHTPEGRRVRLLHLQQEKPSTPILVSPEPQSSAKRYFLYNKKSVPISTRQISRPLLLGLRNAGAAECARTQRCIESFSIIPNPTLKMKQREKILRTHEQVSSDLHFPNLTPLATLSPEGSSNGLWTNLALQ